jgi:hypothetical protein
MQRLKHGQQVLDESLLVFITLLEKKGICIGSNPSFVPVNRYKPSGTNVEGYLYCLKYPVHLV